MFESVRWPRPIRSKAMSSWACLLALLFAHGLCHPQDTLPPAVQQALSAAGLPAQALAAAAIPLRHSDWPWRHQAQRLMQPGSTMKLVTSVVALDRLGPNLRGFTELRSAAPLQGETLQGDLVLQGGGDLELGVPQLWALLLDLRQAGVRHIQGQLLVDRNRYRPARLDLGLPPFDSAPEFPYNVIPDALMLNQGLLPLELRATETGVVASTVPPLPGLTLDSQMTLLDARCAAWDDHWQSPHVQTQAEQTRITLRGAFPRGCVQRRALQLIDRAELTERLFRALWLGHGGSWSGSAVEATPEQLPASTRLLARHSSRPWGELLRHLNKTSDNAWTRLLYLELGVPHMAANPGRSTQQLAADEVTRWFVQARIDATGLVMDNGSGLSRSERISPWQLAQLLRVAYFGPNASDLVMSLPTVGVDGTMGHRLKTGPAAGWARLKTGTLKNVVALAGYVNDPQGRPWAVALIINHDTQAHRGRPALDALVDHFARHGFHAAVPRTGPEGDGP
jgi:D-alanyl-D-alanine carboxypeptidase/D-alanyl-D-alanine-endopeptidase (penicillin-binding protein 4)